MVAGTFPRKRGRPLPAQIGWVARVTAAPTEAWGSGDAYERYVGRWSRKVAAELLRWLAPARGLAWADVGCGTGALAETILAGCEPAAVEGVDASEGFVAAARQRL
jgi:trans-aconitate methyltransferase